MEYINKKLKDDPEKTKWLTEEHNWQGFKHESMPHYQPSVPIQKNYTDCGLYLLENAESFIRDPDFIQKNLYQREVKLFKTRLVEDKRDIMKRIISALSELKTEKPDNQQFVGQQYSQWRETLYQKMTHFSTKCEDKEATVEPTQGKSSPKASQESYASQSVNSSPPDHKAESPESNDLNEEKI